MFDDAVRALADPLRARIVALLADEELGTCHLVEATGARQTNVSNHLRVLRGAGLVVSERAARYTYHRLVPECLEQLAEQYAEIAARARQVAGTRRPCAWALWRGGYGGVRRLGRTDPPEQILLSLEPIDERGTSRSAEGAAQWSLSRSFMRLEETMTKDKPEVLFVCVHNAGRSQMAAGLLNHHAQGRVAVRSAGSAPVDSINPAVV
jgi:ArsR family transcriptional regulator, arsenate/arsenite/antimonite-responsive transcriptional repressor